MSRQRTLWHMSMDKKLHILIVDDNPHNLELLSDIIKNEGYVLITVFSGKEAIDTVQRLPIDLILLDVAMPEMNGYEVCRYFKAHDEYHNIPILFLSAMTKMSDKLAGFEAGGVDYITKPFYPDEVLARVKAHLELRNAQEQIEAQNLQLQNEINRREHAEVELRESEEKFRSLFEKTNSAVFITGLDFVNIDVNHQAARLLGYSVDEIIGKPYTDFLESDESKLGIERSKQLLAGENVPTYERNFLRKDGSEFIADINITLIRDKDNQPLYFYTVINDITEQKQLQNALKDSERRYRDILEHVSEAVFTTDILGHFTFVNPVMVSRSGYLADEILGKHFSILVDESWRDRVLQFYQNQFTERIPETVFSFPLHGFAGEQIWVEQTINLIMDDERITGFLGIARDITERKMIEAERERLIAELDAFGHTVAHDLKSPLSVLQFSSNMLETMFDRMSEEIRNNALSRIQMSVLKMSNIIDALLLLSSVRKQDRIVIHRLNMQHILKEALDRLKMQTEEYNAKIVMSDTLPASFGYAPWVEEIWVNYLSNAMKYGGVPPIIEIGADLLTDDSVRFWVKDNGRGLSSEDREKLFTPFTRLNQVDIKGHGLGLSIVQRIVEKLGGTIGVDSEIGQGSKFYFTLPTS